MSMVRIKTADLIGPQLDYAVALAEGKEDIGMAAGVVIIRNQYGAGPTHGPFSPSRSWSDGGPIIERELMSVREPCWRSRYVEPSFDGKWSCAVADEQRIHYIHLRFGETLLIAAMRCFVSSKLGDEVEVPQPLAS